MENKNNEISFGGHTVALQKFERRREFDFEAIKQAPTLLDNAIEIMAYEIEIEARKHIEMALLAAGVEDYTNDDVIRERVRMVTTPTCYLYYLDYAQPSQRLLMRRYNTKTDWDRTIAGKITVSQTFETYIHPFNNPGTIENEQRSGNY